MNLGLTEKTAIVLAGSKGLGKATALSLSQEGANVVIGARNEKTLNDTVKEIRSQSKGKVLGVSIDVTKLKDLENIVSKTIKEFKRIDILVNNAGGPPAGKFERFSDNDWQKAFELNLLSAVRAIRLVIPHMRKTGKGRIINMVSIAAKEPVENLILSNSIRAAVLGMAKTLSKELAPDNITVNNILTGYFLTDRIRELHNGKKLSDISKDIPLARLGKPEEFGALIAFLASNQASFITGCSIQIDGGLIRSIL